MIDPIQIRLAGIHAAEAANGIAAVARTLESVVEHLSAEDPMAGMLNRRAEVLYDMAESIDKNVLKPLRQELRSLKP